MSARPKLKAVVGPNEMPLTRSERTALRSLLEKQRELKAEMDGVGAEIVARLGLPEETKAEIDSDRGVVRVLADPEAEDPKEGAPDENPAAKREVVPAGDEPAPALPAVKVD